MFARRQTLGYRPALIGTVALATVAALVLAAPASAEVRSGSGTDPVDGGIAPGQDIVSVSAGYDTAGTISAQLTLRGAPTEANGIVAIGYGVLSAGECAQQAVLGGIYNGESVWFFDEKEAAEPAVQSISGNAISFSATSPRLSGKPYNCAIVGTGEAVEENEERFSVPRDQAGPITLVAPPPPPPAPTPPPAPAPAPPPPAPAPKVAKLEFTSSTALTLPRFKWKKVKLQVSNLGTAAAGKVKLKIGKARGVRVKPKSGELGLKSIAAGKAKTVSFKVGLTAKAKRSSELKLTLTGARGVKTIGTLTVSLPQKKKAKGKEKPTPAKATLGERLYYAYENHPSESASLIGFAFIDDTWAYRGIPLGGLPTCTAVTGGPSQDGCVKYSYDPRTGAVNLEGIGAGQIAADGSFELGGEKYSATYIPPAGARYQVQQEYISYVGLCGLITGCSTHRENIALANNGEFVLTTSSLSTFGGSGPGETFVAAGSYPPNQHGTYAVEPKGRLRLSFADGSVQTKTFALVLDPAGKPEPINAGFLLDDKYFIFLPD